jgi:hypothetical protein
MKIASIAAVALVGIAIAVYTWFAAHPIAPLPPVKQTREVTVVVDRVRRVSANEADFSIRITNGTANPVYFLGVDYRKMQRIISKKDDPSLQPALFGVLLEQKTALEDWHVIAPCPDVPPPDVISMNSGDSQLIESGITNPIEALCKKRDLEFSGSFRIAAEYFASEEEANSVLKSYDQGVESASRPVRTVSEPFEIPPDGGTGSQPSNRP